MIYIFNFFILFTYFLVVPGEASLRVGDLPYEEYRVPEGKFPQVGSLRIIEAWLPENFPIPQVPIEGTATLFQYLNMPEELKGRLLITAAHVVHHKEANLPHKKIYFESFRKEIIPIEQVWVHPSYYSYCTQLYGTQSKGLGVPHDIAILLLPRPILGIEPSSLSFANKETVERTFVYSLGFGDSGHLLNPYRFYDSHLKGSYSFLYNKAVCKIGNVIISAISESPHYIKSSPLLNPIMGALEDFSLPSISLPLGTASSGDSGGVLYMMERAIC